MKSSTSALVSLLLSSLVLVPACGGDDENIPVDGMRNLCLGVDCSLFDTTCEVGVCNPTDGTCGTENRANDTPCDDELACTTGETCQDGGCTGTPYGPPSEVAHGAEQDAALAGDATASVTVDNDDCPGQVVIGLELDRSASGSLDGASVVCGGLGFSGPVDDLHVTVGDGTTLPRRGFSNGTAGSIQCPADTIAVGIAGASGSLVDSLTLRCASLALACNGEGTFDFAFGTVVTSEAFGGAGGGPFGPLDCPAGTFAIGATTHHGDQINAFGLRCAEPVGAFVIPRHESR